jgi:two-component system, NtrC family, sensor histidine kinase HydH
MIGIPFSKSRKAVSPMPRRLIFIVISLLCFGLLASTLFTFTTLSRLRTDYLANRGQEIAVALDAQVRGPDRRHNPIFWQSILEANYETYATTVAFMTIIDQNGKILANVGQTDTSAGMKEGVYLFEERLPQHRNQRDQGIHAAADWRIRIGLNTAAADFIRRMAFLQLILSGLAIAALLVLSCYLIHMLNRFLELKEREAAEAQLKSLGIMAASLAHEIRNPLGAMKGLTQLAQEELPAEHAAQTQLRTVVNEAERLEKLVTDLLDFARRKEPEISAFNLAELLSDIKTMLQSQLESSNISLRISLEPNPFHLRSDPAGLRQVLLNVLLNAIDAVPAGGEVVFNAMFDKDGKSIILQIDDSGAGLGPKTSEELFQPFVTTKVRGTGLGLAVSKQIVESLGGSLNLDNLPQGGARCSIGIPVS